VTISLVRHGKAGDRSAWAGDDFLRPLSRRGQMQAEGLLAQFAGQSIDRLLSSPYVRCMESLVALAGERMLAIEPVDALTEGGTLENALTLVRKHAHHDAVMCSHGDIIPMLLDHFAARGVDLGPNPVCPKGCTWVLDVDPTGEVVAATYIPPPVD
jgi:broad specificity phosphatase PhoE